MTTNPRGDTSRQHIQTKLLEHGYDPSLSEGSVVPPVFRTSTFVFPTADAGKRAFQIAHGQALLPEESVALIYSRVNNPNIEIVEDRLAVLDGAEAAAVMSSGMGAISSTLMTLCRPGDHIVFSDPVYGGTETLLVHLLPSFGITSSTVKAGATKTQMWDELKKHPNTKLLYIETPCNPSLLLTSVKAAAQAVAEINKERNLIGCSNAVRLVVDNTMCGPIYLSPLKFGADIILYSVTKFIGGHSDLVAGAALGSKELINRIKGTRCCFGAITEPDTAWLITRSLPSLRIRMLAQMENASSIVKMLDLHPAVERVYYPGHPSNSESQLQIFKEEYTGSGSLITFTVKGGEVEAFLVLNHVRIWNLAVSLGSVESLIQHPSSMTHSGMSDEEKEAAGISEGMIRCSVGLEDPEDLAADLSDALDFVVMSSKKPKSPLLAPISGALRLSSMLRSSDELHDQLSSHEQQQ